MTSTPTDVTQADREEAGDFMASLRGYKQGLDELSIKEGLNDFHPLVQAFARHRLAHQPGDGALAEAQKALDLISRMRGCAADFKVQAKRIARAALQSSEVTK